MYNLSDYVGTYLNNRLIISAKYTKILYKDKKIEIKNILFYFYILITMKFCQNCDNLLYLKISDNSGKNTDGEDMQKGLKVLLLRKMFLIKNVN